MATSTETNPSSNTSSSKKQKNNSTESVTPKPPVQASSKEEKPQLTTLKNNSPYSDEKLKCEGRACVKCGGCRDWYWRFDDKNMKAYTKHDDSICTYDRTYYFYCTGTRGCCFYCSGYGDGYTYWHDDRGDGRYSHDNYLRRLCQCGDNRS